MNQKNHTFEENMQRLEQIVRAMERGDVALEESLKLFQREMTVIVDEGGVYTCPIIKLEPASTDTEYTENELAAVTIFLKKDTPRKTAAELKHFHILNMGQNTLKIICLEKYRRQ